MTTALSKSPNAELAKDASLSSITLHPTELSLGETAALGFFDLETLGMALVECDYTAAMDLQIIASIAKASDVDPKVRLKASELLVKRMENAARLQGLMVKMKATQASDGSRTLEASSEQMKLAEGSRNVALTLMARLQDRLERQTHGHDDSTDTGSDDTGGLRTHEGPGGELSGVGTPDGPGSPSEGGPGSQESPGRRDLQDAGNDGPGPARPAGGPLTADSPAVQRALRRLRGEQEPEPVNPGAGLDFLGHIT